MLIRFVRKCVVDYQVYAPGDSADVAEDKAAQLIAGGYAAKPEPAAPVERAAEAVEVETATALRKRTRR